MKVEAIDWMGDSVGVAYHENDHGTVQIAISRECVVVGFRLNDGQPHALGSELPMMPGDELRLKIKKERPMDSYKRHLQELQGHEDLVDNMATNVSWWRRIINWWRKLSWTTT